MKVVKLGSVLSDIAMGPFGSNLKVNNFQNQGVPVIRGQNLSDFYVSDENLVFVSPEKASSLSRALANPGEIVVTHRGTLGQVSMIPANGKYDLYLVSQSQMRLAVDPKRADARFITYWMRSPRGQHTLGSFATQTGVPAIAQPTASLRDYPISLPPLSEQVAIADLLGSLDDKIVANQQIIGAAISLAESLVTRNLLTSEIRLGDVAQITMGTSPKGLHLKEEVGGLPFYQGVRDFGALTPQRRVFTDRPVREAEAGDILFAVRAPVGEVNIASEPTAIGRGLAAIRGRANHVALFYLLRAHPEIWNPHQDSGTVFASINKTDLSNAHIPKIEIDQSQSDLLIALHNQALVHTNQNLVLAKTRDELLPLLISGKITVKEAEQEATAAGADIGSEENEA